MTEETRTGHERRRLEQAVNSPQLQGEFKVKQLVEESAHGDLVGLQKEQQAFNCMILAAHTTRAW